MIYIKIRDDFLLCQNILRGQIRAYISLLSFDLFIKATKRINPFYFNRAVKLGVLYGYCT